MTKLIDAKGFFELITSEYPDLREALEEDGGLVTMQISTFHNHVQQAIDQGNFKVLDKSYKIACQILEHGDDGLKNAIHVSFLEHLDFRGPYGTKAFSLMPTNLVNAWKDINQYMEALLQGDWIWKGPVEQEDV